MSLRSRNTERIVPPIIVSEMPANAKKNATSMNVFAVFAFEEALRWLRANAVRMPPVRIRNSIDRKRVEVFSDMRRGLLNETRRSKVTRFRTLSADCVLGDAIFSGAFTYGWEVLIAFKFSHDPKAEKDKITTRMNAKIMMPGLGGLEKIPIDPSPNPIQRIARRSCLSVFRSYSFARSRFHPQTEQ